jgi:hypothetical protein
MHLQGEGGPSCLPRGDINPVGIPIYENCVLASAAAIFHYALNPKLREDHYGSQNCSSNIILSVFEFRRL